VITKGLLYYTCNTHAVDIEMACRAQLLKVRNDYELGCVSRKPTAFGDWNIIIDGPRSPKTLHLQILAGLEFMKSDVIFFVENDCLYHPSHFDFIPHYAHNWVYFNTNVWKVRYPDGHAVWTDDLQQTSGLCAYRSVLLGFYRERIKRIERVGFDGHYEPGPKNSSLKTGNWQSKYPNLDIRHNGTLTKSKWSPEEFRNKKYAKGWREADSVEGWYEQGEFSKLLEAEYV